MILKNQIIKDYKQNGVVALRKVFSPKWIEELRKGIEKNLKNPSIYFRKYSKKEDLGQFVGDYCNWQKISEYKNFVYNSEASNVAKQLMESHKVNFFHEHMLIKEPGTLNQTPWHHDQPYYCVNGQDNVSLWVPLDPVSKKSSMKFIAGSHKWNNLFTPKKFMGEDYEPLDKNFESIPDFDQQRHKFNILSFDLKLGDCIAFHFRTVHGASGNHSTKVRRRAISWRWTGDDATFILRKGTMSPPFPNFKQCNLKPGDPLDCSLFPVI